MNSFNYKSHFKSIVNNTHIDGRYRSFTPLQRQVGKFPEATAFLPNGEKKNVTIWCSNDYLGMGQNPQVIESIKLATDKYGAGAGGTRNISGTTQLITELEESLCDLHQKESSLVFTSGYTSNEGSLGAILRLLPDDAVVFSDELNHASMIIGVRNGGRKKHIFRHNDLEHLESLLKSTDIKLPKLIAFESVYSMDGDIASIKELVELAKWALCKILISLKVHLARPMV
jgi:5-aminolevulinate synthase